MEARGAAAPAAASVKTKAILPVPIPRLEGAGVGLPPRVLTRVLGRALARRALQARARRLDPAIRSEYPGHATTLVPC